MGEMSSYYDDEGLGTDEELEAEMSKDLRIFVICYENGNFHSMTSDQDIAYSTADRIDGIIGELTNVHRPLREKDIPEPLRSEIINFLDNPKDGVRRERPEPKAA